MQETETKNPNNVLSALWTTAMVTDMVTAMNSTQHDCVMTKHVKLTL